MTNTNVVDLIKTADGESRPVPIRDRIRRRIEVLNAWVAAGIPAGKLSGLPTSLRKAKDWNDDELGILPIGSPNDFTTKHSEWGQDVATIARLLTKLKHRHGRPKAKSPAGESKSSPETIGLLEAQLAEVVSQWHSARNEAVEERNRAEAEEARALRLTDALNDKEAEVAELRKRLSQSGTGLRAVE